MSVMRLTMVVHSVNGDEDGEQEAVMKVCDLPDSIDPDHARRLMGALANHIDDEVKFIQDQDDTEQQLEERAREDQRRRVEDDTTFDDPKCVCVSNADEDIDDTCPVHGLRIG